MVKINCIKVFETSKNILLKDGLWPVVTITACAKLKLIFNLILDMTLFILIALNIFNAIKTKNIKHLNRMICILIPLMNYSAKSLTLVAHKQCFGSLLEDIKSEIFNSHNEKLNENIQVIYRFSKLMIKYFALVLSIYIIIASFLPIIIDIEMTLPLPFDIGRLRVLYNILHFFTIVYLSVNSVCFDVLFLMLMGLCVAQLNILERKLRYLVDDTEQLYTNSQSEYKVAQSNLKECIILHELISRFVKKLGVLLSLPLFTQYACGCFTICNTILQVTILGGASSTNILTMCAYSGTAFGQMAAYHWVGNEIIFKSNKIIESCYTSKWYELDIKSQKSLLLLMEGAKRPLVVQLYGLIFISLESLLVVLKWAYSIFTLIKAKYN